MHISNPESVKDLTSMSFFIFITKIIMSEKLFEKYTLNNKVIVPNRLVVAPLTLFGSNPDGTINKEESEYLKQRATNMGLYILGATAVSQEGIAFICQPRALVIKIYLLYQKEQK